VETLEAIAARHGVLRYRPTPVEEREIECVLRAAAAAPSPANTQPWEYVVVTDPLLVQEIAEYLVRTQEEYVLRRLLETPEDFIAHLMRLYDGLSNAPCYIVLCRHQRVDLGRSEYRPVVRDWDLCSLGAAMANLMMAATDLGLGTRWFGSPMMEGGGAPLRQVLEVPDGVEIVAVTPLGYHDERRKKRPVQPLETLTTFRRGDRSRLAALLKGRLALEDVVHYDRYGGMEWGPDRTCELGSA
jgi:nitroreductase